MKFFGKRKPTVYPPRHPSRVLMKMDGSTTPWTLGDSYEGAIVFGSQGSGKTSGTGWYLSQSMLREKFGGLVMTSSEADLQLWRRFAKRQGREDNIIVVDGSGRWRFNFFDAEMGRAASDGISITENLIELINTMIQIGEDKPKTMGAGNDAYWQEQLNLVLMHAINLARHGAGQISFPLIYEIISQAPQSSQQVNSDSDWQRASVTYQLAMKLGENSHLPHDELYEYFSAAKFFMETFPSYPPNTRMSVISMFLGMGRRLMQSEFRKVLLEPSTIDPEFCRRGGIIVLNFPILKYGQTGQIIQGAVKYVWQRMLASQKGQGDLRPVFIWADEAQLHATTYDQTFLAVCREARVAMVYLTQSITALQTKLGQLEGRELANKFGTKFVHSVDADTRRYFIEDVGNEIRGQTSYTTGQEKGQTSMSMSRQPMPQLTDKDFDMLYRGRMEPPDNGSVSCFVKKTGKIWQPSNKNWIKTTMWAMHARS